MSKKTGSSLPSEFGDLVAAAGAFSAGARAMTFPDGRGVAVLTEAARFATLVGATVEGLARPPVKFEALMSPEDLAKRIGPAVDSLTCMAEEFRVEAAAGRMALPPMNDLEIGMTLMEQAPEDLFRLAHLIAAEYEGGGVETRRELASCLGAAGVPVETLGLQIPILLKLLFVILLILIAIFFPDLILEVLSALIALLRADLGGQGGKGGYPYKYGGGDGGDGDGDGGGDGGGKKKKKGGEITCGSIFERISIAVGKTQVDAIGTARRNAQIVANTLCPARCPARLIFISPFKITKQANGLIRVEATYRFRCT